MAVFWLWRRHAVNAGVARESCGALEFGTHLRNAVEPGEQVKRLARRQ